MAALVDPNNVDRLRQVEDIATDLNLIGGHVLGDRPTRFCRRLMRLTSMQMSRHFFLIGLVSLTVAIAAFGCAGHAARISEAELLEYASMRYDKGLYVERRHILGKLNKTEVVADFVCSDLCPTYTVRVIHFDVEPGPRCAEIGGVERSVPVPIAITTRERAFCFPKVLVDNWDAYIR